MAQPLLQKSKRLRELELLIENESIPTETKVDVLIELISALTTIAETTVPKSR